MSDDHRWLEESLTILGMEMSEAIATAAEGLAAMLGTLDLDARDEDERQADLVSSLGQVTCIASHDLALLPCLCGAAL